MNRAEPLLPEPIGHRGAAAVAPENTLASIRAALAAGVRWIEFDVRLTADGVPVLLHDATLDRTTDTRGRLSDRSFAELAAVDAGVAFADAFAGEPVPTLDGALDEIAGRARAVIELKADTPGEFDLRDAVVDRLASRSDAAGHVVTSMEWDLLRSVRSRVSNVDVAVTARRLEARDPVEAALDLGANAIHVHRARAGIRLCARAHEAGLRVRAYTVNDLRALRPLVRAGVDAVFTDDPGHLATLIREIGGRA